MKILYFLFCHLSFRLSYICLLYNLFLLICFLIDLYRNHILYYLILVFSYHLVYFTLCLPLQIL